MSNMENLLPYLFSITQSLGSESLNFIVTDHGSHFQNKMISKISVRLGFYYDKYTPYYPQANGQVESINKVLKNKIQ